MDARSLPDRLVAYAWAAPNTALGAMAGLVVLCLGGRMRFVRGTAEFHGGLVGRLFASLPRPFRFGAMTLGHVVLGVSQAELAALRGHERVHVRQYERWGPLFLPAYALSSAWQAVHGRHGYRDNYFERQARASAANPERADPSFRRTDLGVRRNRRTPLVQDACAQGAHRLPARYGPG